MAFNSFLELGQADRFEPEDLLGDDEDFSLDQDPEYGIPPQDRAPKPQQDHSKAELLRIQQQNEERERQFQQERLENARRLGMLESQIQFLRESRESNIKDPQQANDFVENFWAKPQEGQQKQPAKAHDPTTQIPAQAVEQLVDRRLGTLAQHRAAQQAEEDRLAARFKREHADIIAAGGGPDAYREWERLKALRGDLPADQRYQLMVEEMKHRVRTNKFSAPSSENPTVPSKEMEDMFSNDPRSERRRQKKKAIDTARRVKHFRDDQLHRTSIAMG